MNSDPKKRECETWLGFFRFVAMFFVVISMRATHST